MRCSDMNKTKLLSVETTQQFYNINGLITVKIIEVQTLEAATETPIDKEMRRSLNKQTLVLVNQNL